MKNMRRLLSSSTLVLVTLFLTSCAAGPDNNQNSLIPKGDNAEKIHNLFTPVFWLATAIGVAILVATVVVGFKFRETPKNKEPKQIHGNSILEIGWTILPILILIGVAIPTVQTIFDLAKPAEPGAIHVEVVGKQWWWQFAVQTDEYTIKNVDGTDQLDADGNHITSNRVVVANELVIPVNRQVEFAIKACNEDTPIIGQTAQELREANPCNVVHSFWVPSLGGKVDAIPGRTNRLVFSAKEEGLYTGQCAEYCGLSHAMMRMQIRVVSQSEYDQWLAGLKEPSTTHTEVELEEIDTLIRKFGCANCHAFSDPSEKTYGPNLTNFGPKYDDEVLGGGSILKDYERTWRWVFNSTDWENGYGIPMQADDCRLGPAPGLLVEGARCVGMPNYSIPYTYINADGDEVIMPAMKEQEAQKIARYLLNNK